jgi:hypothetical protein
MRELNDDVRQVLSAIEAGRDEVLVDDMTRQVRAGLSHQRRNSADQHRFGNPLRAVPRDIADDLAAAGRMSDMDRILEGRPPRSERQDRRRRGPCRCPARARSTARARGDRGQWPGSRARRETASGCSQHRPRAASHGSKPAAPIPIGAQPEADPPHCLLPPRRARARMARRRR